ncbi:DUF2796 domain-containing protein [Thiorhodovibrio frisius]|uniref:DUF2796 domain-containing protein n=1 Tax=Thiorhodovibrio frisius TaxID=631362 RepID=H8Z8K0_9GAMM|nr:DUF2796 domain-containing protein [Thiorhodovibrio frisius]EIC19405.1 Protein of unknown function (DUF2796) [Thiorhodovibrio frisius]WPL22293.1 hypothetical protein Thiofri_02453 [Thiorhodovibrio frisius]
MHPDAHGPSHPGEWISIFRGKQNLLFIPLLLFTLASTPMSGTLLAAEDPEEHDHGAAHEHDHDQHGHTHRQQDAHVHGIGRLNLALDGPALHLELISPAANLVGFEHPPTTATDQAKLAAAVAILEDGARLFQLNPSARCELRDSVISSGLLDTGQKNTPHAELEPAPDDHATAPAHDHDGHAHDEDSAAASSGQESHADINVRYRFECAKPSALKLLKVELFEVFPDTETLEVQFVLDDHQGGMTLNHDNPELRF